MTTPGDATIYRKRPVEVEAIRYDGHNEADLRRFCPSLTRVQVGTVTHGGPNQYDPAVRTLEGVMRISKGDWLIKGTRGEFYPCKPGPFVDTFERPQSSRPRPRPLVTP